jgi:hypothetical protein
VYFFLPLLASSVLVSLSLLRYHLFTRPPLIFVFLPFSFFLAYRFSWCSAFALADNVVALSQKKKRRKIAKSRSFFS